MMNYVIHFLTIIYCYSTAYVKQRQQILGIIFTMFISFNSILSGNILVDIHI